MRILLVTQYFPPETGAAQNRLWSWVESLTQAGHDVRVLTGMPKYPQGEIFDGYKDHLFLEERQGNARVVRTWVYATKSKSFVKRLLVYFSFVFSSIFIGAWKIGKQDIVIAESPPLFLGISGFLLSRLKGAKLVLNISDLWPASAVALGILRNKALIKASISFEEFLYRKSHLITGQTKGIVENIRSRCAGRPVALIPNGVSLDTLVPAAKLGETQRVRGEFDLNGHFVVGYAGLHGMAQGLETILKAAEIVSGYSDIVFVLFGDGPEKPRLMRIAVQANAANVRFYSTQPASRMPQILAAWDVSLVPLRRQEIFKGALPSKMFEAMGAGVPVIVSIEGEAKTLVQESHGGICVAPEDPQAIAEAILQVYRDLKLRRSLGENAQRYVRTQYNRTTLANAFEEHLRTVHSSA